MNREPTLEEIGALLADLQLTRESGGNLTDVLQRHTSAASALMPMQQQAPVPAPVIIQQAAPERRSMAPYVAAGIGGVVAVVAVCTVLTALLLAVAITAVSLTVAFLVIRSLLNQQTQTRR